ncbi:MAG TPA: glycosyltransferase family A protein [Mycobacteriales bacterium]|nr:glycosyltransferase family A protein [Mycobacteriales bacterium]
MTAGGAAPAVAAPLASAESAAWSRAVADVTVVVSSHNRVGFLGGLIDALAAQREVSAEVVIVDNGSTDGTWQLLVEACAATSLALNALRVEFHDGPAVPRNTAVSIARAPLIAFTDDDCLPTPTWLAELTAQFDADTVIVQGQTLPEPGGWAGPWGRSLKVTGPTGLYETANLGVRRDALLAVGGFPRDRLLSGRPFGEDVLLGAAVARTGGFRFTLDALVHHRVLPATYRDFIRERRRLAGFPQLLRHVPELRRLRFLHAFLGKRRAVTDLGLLGIAAGVVVSLALWNPLGLLALLAALPWLRVAWREAWKHPGKPRPVRALQLMVADVIGFGALLSGSVRARRVLI